MTQADAVAIDRLRADATDMSVADAGLLGIAREGRNRRLNDVARDLRSLITAYESQAERLREVEGAYDVATGRLRWAASTHPTPAKASLLREWADEQEARALTQSPPATEKTDA